MCRASFLAYPDRSLSVMGTASVDQQKNAAPVPSLESAAGTAVLAGKGIELYRQ